MGKQQTNPRKSLWENLSNDGLYTGTYEQFHQQFSNPESIERLYNKMREDELYTKSYEEFDSQFFGGLGKPTEVSPQGSGVTSGISGEPGQNTILPPEQQLNTSETSSGQSLPENTAGIPPLADPTNVSPQIAEANRIAAEYDQEGRAFEFEVPEGFEIIQGEVDPQTNRLRSPYMRNIETGEQFNIVPPTDPATLEQAAQLRAQGGGAINPDKVTFTESIANSWKNMLSRFETIPFRQEIANGGMLQIRPEALANMTPEQREAAFAQARENYINAYEALERYSQENPNAPTREIVQSWQNGDAAGLVAGAFNALTGFASSLVLGSVTGGIPLAVDIVGDFKNEYNQSKADRLGISTRELVDRGLDEDKAPKVLAGISYAAEKIGIKGASKFIPKSVMQSVARKIYSSPVVKSMLDAVVDMGGEGLTEIFSEGLQSTSTEMAANDTYSGGEVLESLLGNTFNEDNWEVFWQGAIGKGVMNGSGAVINTLMRRSATNPELRTKVDQLVEISNTIRATEGSNPALNVLYENLVSEVASDVAQDALDRQGLNEAQQNTVAQLEGHILMMEDSKREVGHNETVANAIDREVERARQEIDAIKTDAVEQQEIDTTGVTIASALAPTSQTVTLMNGERGDVRLDGQTVVFETNDVIRELGNVDEISDRDLSDFGLEVELPLNISVAEDNSVTIDGQKFLNPNEDPLSALNYNDQGDVVSVSLQNESGRPRTIRGQRAQQIAYEYTLKNFEQNATEQQIEAAIAESEALLRTQEEFEQGQTQAESESVIESPNEQGGQLSETEQSNMESSEVPAQSSEVAPVGEAGGATQEVVNQSTEGGTADAIQIRETEEVPMGGTSGDSAPVDGNVRESTGAQEEVQGGQGQEEVARLLSRDNITYTQTETLDGKTEWGGDTSFDTPDLRYISKSEREAPFIFKNRQGEITGETGIQEMVQEAVPNLGYTTIRRGNDRYLLVGGAMRDKVGREGGYSVAIKIDDNVNEDNFPALLDIDVASVLGVQPREVIRAVGSRENQNKVFDKVLEVLNGPQTATTEDAQSATETNPDTIQSQEEVTPAQTRRRRNTPKALLKGISDRLSQSGLVNEVVFTNSENLQGELSRAQAPSTQRSLFGFTFFRDSDFTRTLTGRITGVKSAVRNQIQQERTEIEQRARRNGTWRRAPNGRPSNLSPEQWVTVRTKRFKDWFGDWENNPRSASKVVDENGEPMIYYSGSSIGFNEFSKDYFYTGEGAMYYGAGFYFTPRQETAKSYARQSRLGNEKRTLTNDFNGDLGRIAFIIDNSLPTNLTAQNKAETLAAIRDIEQMLEKIKKRASSQSSRIIQAVDSSVAIANSLIKQNRAFIQSPSALNQRLNVRSQFNDLMDTSFIALRGELDVADTFGVGEGNVFSVFLNARNPLNWEAPANPGLVSRLNRELAKRRLPQIRGPFNTNGDIYRTVAEALNEPMAPTNDVRQYTKTSEFFNSIGIDAVLHTTSVEWNRGAYFNQVAGERQLIVFEPNQIKSATANEGTFSPENPDIRFQSLGSAINGFYDANTGRVVINEDTAGIDTPIHEFAHAWEQLIEKQNPELHARGLELIQTPEGAPYVEYVRQTQPGLEGRDLYKEALVQAIGDRGARLIESQRNSPIKQWLKDAWDFIGRMVGITGRTADQIANMTLNEYADAVAVDLLSGKPYNSTPNGDIVMETSATSESTLSDSERKIAAFMERMRNKHNIQYQGQIDNNRLSPQDLVEFMDVAEEMAKIGQISTLADLRSIAHSIGIRNDKDIRTAWAIAKDSIKGAPQTTAFKKSQITEALGQRIDALSIDEKREIGKRLVDEGILDPDQFVAEIIENPIALQTHEVFALAYGYSRLQNRIDDVSRRLRNSPMDGDLLIEQDGLLALQHDYQNAMALTATEQGQALAVRDIESDQDFNAVSALREMKKVGEVDADTQARIEAAGRELNAIKSEIRARMLELDELRAQSHERGINAASTAAVPRRKGGSVRARRDAIEVLDSLDLGSFAMAGMNFQTNNILRFSIAPNPQLSEALSTAVATMKEDINGGMPIVDALEKAVDSVNESVGKGNWNELAFRSKFVNAYTDRGHVSPVRKPYIGTDGKPVVPGAYLRDIVSQYRAENNSDMTIDQMVEAVQTELGPSFSERDVRDAISGYGRASVRSRNDDQKNIATAKTIARLTSRLEDLENMGYSPTSVQGKARTVNEEIKDLRLRINELIDSLVDSPEYKAQMKQALEQKKRYIENYIQEVEDRRKFYEDANRRGERVPDGYFKRVPKYDFTSDPDIIALEKRREEAKNRLKEEVYRHTLKNRTWPQRMFDHINDIFFNTTRMLSAGADLSSYLVQAGFITLSDPVTSTRSLISSVKSAGSLEGYNDYFTNLQRQPLYEYARAAKLNMQLPGFYQSIQEEQLGTTNPVTWLYEWLIDKAFANKPQTAQKWKDRFPFTAAERQYSIFLSDIRFNLFERVVHDAQNHFGLDVKTPHGKEMMKDIATAINDITMASNIRTLQGSTRLQKIGNMVFFSLRKLAAGWKLMTKLPYYGGSYVLNRGAALAGSMGITNASKLRNTTEFDSFMFQKLYGRYAGASLGVGALITVIPSLIANAAYDEGEDEEPWPMYNPNVLNATSSDFMKLRWGNTRMDFSLGIAGNTVLLSRLISGGYMTSSDPVFREFGGRTAGMPNKTEQELIIDYFKNKLAPTPSIAYNYFLGGQYGKSEATDRIAESFYPMWAAGTMEQYQATNSIANAAAFTALGIMGISANTYGGVEFADHRGTDNAEARRIFERLLVSDTSPVRREKNMYNPSGSGVTKLQGSDFAKQYKKDYDEYMTAATIANKDIISNKKLTPEKVESIIGNMKKRANKYAEIKNTGIYLDETFRKVKNSRGDVFKLPNNQLGEKARIVVEYMNGRGRSGLSSLRLDVRDKFREEGKNPTPEILEMESFLNLYNEANREASERMTRLIDRGIIQPIPEFEYDPDVDEEGNYDN